MPLLIVIMWFMFHGIVGLINWLTPKRSAKESREEMYREFFPDYHED